MLLSTIGEEISPSLIEVITGFSLGACFEQNNLIFFDACISSPDKGVCHAFEILGFNVIEKVSKETEQIPLEELKTDLLNSPVMLGPLDMGYLNYNPNYRSLGGCDHYVVALAINEKEILLHDPAGFPYVWLSLEQLELAWKAEKITCSRGSYRSWVSPQRVSNPTNDEIYNKAIQLFKVNYEEQKKYAFKENKPVGGNAIRLKAEQIENGMIGNGELGHFIHFAFPVGARRALDFSNFFNGRHTQLAALKNNQAQLFGKCQSLAAAKQWGDLAKTLALLADTEGEIETAILSL